jgi:NADH pyrophosphatase NudC (nudix superfamily)
LIEVARTAKTDFVTSEQKSETCPLPEPGKSTGEDSAEYWRWCPRCGHELHNEKCKLRCPRCHYFMSCSDFD